MYVSARIVILVVTMLILGLLFIRKNVVDKSYLLGISVIIILYSGLLMYKIGSFPNIFIDEGNGMYDSWSISRYGVDSNLISNPVYLQGHAGQGQSILYARLAGVSLRIFGYHLWAFRLPLIIISIANLILISYTVFKRMGGKAAFWSAVAVSTSPYLIGLSRFGMDCNVSLFMLSMGTVIFYLGCTQNQNQILKIFQLCLGAIFIGLTAYSYNVSWLYLPGYLLLLIGLLLAKKLVKLRELILPVLLLGVEIIPILIFAVRSNVTTLNKTVKILFWTSPSLPVGRVNESFIPFDKHILISMYTNVLAGIKMLVNGSDNLAWNSVGNFGPYYMFTLPFFLIGLWRIVHLKKISDVFLLSLLLGNIPIFLLVIPNWNHWIFMHIPSLLIIVRGIAEFDHSRIFKVSLLLTYLVFSVSFVNRYFTDQRYTGWTYESIGEFRSLGIEKYKNVYYDTNDGNFLYVARLSLPVSPYEYQKTKENPYSKQQLMIGDSYRNFKRYSQNDQIKATSLVVIPQDRVSQLQAKLRVLKFVKKIKVNDIEYNVYKK